MKGMKAKKILAVFNFSLLLCSCTPKHGINFRWDNDIVNHTDENYTNGVEISYYTKPEKTHIAKYLPSLRLSDDDPEDLELVGFRLKQDMYTPGSLKELEIIKDDNPYAGVLSFSVKRINADYDTRISTELTAGCSGDYSYAKETQKFVHNDLGFGGDPKGWDNQISTSPVVNFAYHRQQVNIFKTVTENFQVMSRIDTLTRIGNMYTDFTYDYGWTAGRNIPKFDRTNMDRFSLYGFLHLYVTLRAHNLFYDGNLIRNSPHTVDSEHIVNGVDTGLGVEYKNYVLKFHWNYRTRDYKEQEDKFHGYGILSLGVDW